MNKQVWEKMSDQEKAWVEAASGKELSIKGGHAYEAAAQRGIKTAKDNGVELFQLSNIWLVLHGKRSYIWEELKVRVRPFSILYKIERKAA